MDFVANFLTGLSVAAGGFVFGLPLIYIAWVWLRKRLFSSILVEFERFLVDLSRYPEAYEDLTAPLMAGATNAIGRAFSMLAADVQKNPDKYAAILKPVLMKAVKEVTSGAGGGMPRFKWQDLIGIVMQRFIGQMASEGPKKLAEAATEANPFA